MKFDVEELGATRRKIMVTIPAEDVDRALDKAYSQLNQEVKVDGFRPGKTPRSILEKRYAQSVEADVVERIIPAYFYKALSDAAIIPVDEPEFEEKEFKLSKGSPLSFTATVDIRPDFPLEGYKGLEVKDEKVEVTEEELSAALEDIRESHSTLETVTDERLSVKDDFVVIDFEGFVEDKPLPGGKAENYPLQLGSGQFIPGFEEQLEGLKAGEQKDVTVTFPVDYKSKDLAGKPAVFKITLKEIKKKVLPVLDDEFAKDAGAGDTLADLKERVKADIMGYKEKSKSMHLKEQIRKQLTAKFSFELPASLVERETRSLVVRRHQELMQTGQSASEAGRELKEYETLARTKAEEMVKAALILGAISDKENLHVSDADLEGGIRKLAAETGYMPDKIKELYHKRDGNLDGLRGMLTEDKVLDFLLKEAKVV